VSAWGLQLIASILTADDPRKAWEFVSLERGLVADNILNMEARGVFEFMRMWFERPMDYGIIPSLQRVGEQFPQLVLPTAVEPLPDLCRAVMDEHLKQQLLSAQDTLAQSILEESPTEALRLLQENMAKISEQYVSEPDTHFAESMPGLITDHLAKLHDNEGLLGIPWPWDELNQETQGIHPGDMIVFYALPKSMKTWLALYVATWLFQRNYRILVFSREMQSDTMSLRCASIVAELDYARLKKGDLTKEELTRLYEAMDYLENYNGTGDLIYTRASKADGSAGGVSDIHRKIERYHPDLVILDSAYMMSDDREKKASTNWSNLQAISQDVKQMCAATKIPTIMVWQENEAKALKFKGTGARGTASIAMASQLVYDCDIAIRCILNEAASELSLHFTATRDCKLDGFTINAKPGYDFSFAGWELHDLGEKKEENGPKEKHVVELASLFKNSIMQNLSGKEEDDNADP